MITLPSSAILLALANDRATWHTVRHYPATPVIGLICHVVDCAAVDPGWWRVARWLLAAPGVSAAEIADLSGQGICRVVDLLKLHSMAIIPPLPTDAFDVWDATGMYDLTPRRVPGGITADNTLRLADWAARHPTHWQVLRLWYSSKSSVDCIADTYHLTRGQVAAWCLPPTKGDLGYDRSNV